MNNCNFDWNLFWSAISAIATATACIIALWQSVSANSRKLTISVQTDRVAFCPETDFDEPVIEIKCANTGINIVWIQGIAIRIDDKYYQQLSKPDSPFYVQFPCELRPAQSMTYVISKRALQGYMDNHSQYSNIWIYVADTLGKQYHTKCTNQVRELKI